MGAKLLVSDVNPQVKDYLFYCIGCGNYHGFLVRTDGGRPAWTFNGNLDKPTFEPSLLYPRTHGRKQCHLYLRNGIVEYLQDCDHEYKGTNYELPNERNR